MPAGALAERAGLGEFPAAWFDTTARHKAALRSAALSVSHIFRILGF